MAGEDLSLMDEGLRFVEEADLVILTLGDKYGTCSLASMGEGIDSTYINLLKCQEAFIERAAQFRKPLVGIHFPEDLFPAM